MLRMKGLIGLGAVLAVGLFLTGTVLSQDKDKAGDQGAPEMSPEMQKAMQQWIEAGTPGPNHERLAKCAGKYTAACKTWMAPDGPALESVGSCEMKPMYDGRYLISHFKGDWMGKPFEGVSFEGYDNMRKEYVSIWLDSMSTGIMYQTGQPSKDGKSITYTGTCACPETGELNKPCKTVIRYESDDRLVMDMYENVGKSDEFKMMEITYTRQK